MIPIKLLLTNFMPYRGEIAPIDFSGIRIASICGNNGAGKSSLIDAMTWALWGKTRSKSDDELIHQGEHSMQVVFDFAVRLQKYRVIRKRSRGRSKSSGGQSSLDFFIAAGETFKPLTGDRIADTEKKIIETLHMTYETFINSAFLRQGHADQFTVARPVERKAVLTSVLGLDEYDRLESGAKEFAGQAEANRLSLENNIRDIDAELLHQPVYESELAEARRQLDEIENSARGLESLLVQLRSEKEVLAAKKAQLNQLEDQANRIKLDMNRWLDTSHQHSLRVQAYRQLLDQRLAIETGYERLVSLRKLNEEFTRKLRIVNSMQDRHYKLEAAVAKASQALLREHDLVKINLDELQQKWQRSAALKTEMQTARDELARLEADEKDLSDKKENYQHQVNETKRAEADRVRLENEITEISEKLNILEKETGAHCPLCERELGVDHIKLIKEKFSLELSRKSGLIQSLLTQITAGKTETGRIDNELRQSDARLRKTRQIVQAKSALLEREIAEAEEAGKMLATRQQLLQTIEERLAARAYAQEEQQALRQLEIEIKEINFDPDEHDRVASEIAGPARDFENRKHRLDEAARLISQESEAVQAAEQAVRELQSSLDDCARRKVDLSTEVQKLPSVVLALAETEKQHQEYADRQKAVRESYGSAREKLNRCVELKSIRSQKNESLRQAAHEVGIYRELAEAFGKKGVQALLIETALPEIEAETNRLLSRMTDNRLHVKFETLRETRKGDLLETLDINISDELGTRSYEMFSGGEAFRINFAIRVALSKFLARRAGAPLPTLIIDEGFGTQDATGMEKIREAITSIQDDFEKILVITHVEEFRDAFPVRIDIVKGSHGSTVEVS